jgi:cobalt-zinc-cadmium efflux system outer membrane protein
MFSSSIRRARLCVALVGVLSAPFVTAADAASAPHIEHSGPHFTLSEALARAQARHPLFASYRAQLQAADARAVQAGIRPAPTLNLAVENAFGTGEVSGYSAAETTLGFSQLIERGGLRDRRIEAADAGRDRLSTDAEIARLDLRAEVARRFVHVLSDQAQLVITREATELARSTLAEVERRVAAARAPLAERSRAQISLERARLAEEHAEHELLSSRRHAGRFRPGRRRFAPPATGREFRCAAGADAGHAGPAALCQ